MTLLLRNLKGLNNCINENFPYRIIEDAAAACWGCGMGKACLLHRMSTLYRYFQPSLNPVERAFPLVFYLYLGIVLVAVLNFVMARQTTQKFEKTKISANTVL